MQVYEDVEYHLMPSPSGQGTWVNIISISVGRTVTRYVDVMTDLSDAERLALSHHFYRYVLDHLDVIRGWPRFISACRTSIESSLLSIETPTDKAQYQEYLSQLQDPPLPNGAAPAA